MLETPQKDSVAEPPEANEARRECLAGRAAEPELDGFLGQAMAAMTRQLGAVSSRLRVTQASLAIQLTRLAQAARQAVVLEERNRLAGEIHDGMAQSFTAICMQLGVAKEELSSKEGDALCSIQRAIEVANLAWLKHVVAPTICAQATNQDWPWHFKG